jgi:phage baseplate assembly protein V
MQGKVRDGFTLNDLEHCEPYGYTSHPLPGCELIVASLGGNRGRALVLMAHDRRHRIVIAEGETAVYTHQGEVVHLRSDRSILVKAGTKVLLDAPLTQLTGALDVGGPITCDSTIDSAGDQIAGGISQINHRHSNPEGGLVGGAQ